MLRYLHSDQCLWWISVSLDIMFGTVTDTAHLQERNKTFQVIFYNPRDWIQLPCNKLMDTVKTLGYFTEAVNRVFHTTLGSTGVRFHTLFKKAFALLKCICQHNTHFRTWILHYRNEGQQPKITCKQKKKKHWGKPWCFKVMFHTDDNANTLPQLMQ